MSTELAFLLFALLWVVVLLSTRGKVAGRQIQRPPQRSERLGNRTVPLSSGRGAEEVWMNKLLTLTRGNQGAIERGVSAKRAKFPQASRAELLQLLHDEYIRDRR